MLLTTNRLADEISVSPRTLERWRIEGFGPKFCHAGRRVLYIAHDVEQWLLTSRKNSTSQIGSCEFDRSDICILGAKNGGQK